MYKLPISDNADVSNPEMVEGANWPEFFEDIREPDIDKLTHTPTLAERILFPPPEDSESSEESDWIDSDSDGPVDWREELIHEDAQRRIFYHPEAHIDAREEAAEDPMLQELVALPLIEAVCGEGGMEAVREVIEAQDPIIDGTDEKGVECNDNLSSPSSLSFHLFTILLSLLPHHLSPSLACLCIFQGTLL